MNMPRIKVTGFLEIEDSESDPHDPTGLTADAFERYSQMLMMMEDVDFEDAQ
jgi:hypothetical protein